MSIQIVVDMNLSLGMDCLSRTGGLAGGSLVERWRSASRGCDDHGLGALTHRRAVFTHDLDFGTALALTHGGGPSVIQVRGRRVLPEQMGDLILAALKAYETELRAGALVVVEATKCRVRLLPL